MYTQKLRSKKKKKNVAFFSGEFTLPDYLVFVLGREPWVRILWSSTRI